MSLALRSAPALQDIEMTSSSYLEKWIQAGHISTITESKSLQQIRSHGRAGQERRKALMREHSVSKRAIGMFDFIETSFDRSLCVFSVPIRYVYYNNSSITFIQDANGGGKASNSGPTASESLDDE